MKTMITLTNHKLTALCTWSWCKFPSISANRVWPWRARGRKNWTPSCIL